MDGDERGNDEGSKALRGNGGRGNPPDGRRASPPDGGRVNRRLVRLGRMDADWSPGTWVTGEVLVGEAVRFVQTKVAAVRLHRGT